MQTETVSSSFQPTAVSSSSSMLTTPSGDTELWLMKFPTDFDLKLLKNKEIAIDTTHENGVVSSFVVSNTSSEKVKDSLGQMDGSHDAEIGIQSEWAVSIRNSNLNTEVHTHIDTLKAKRNSINASSNQIAAFVGSKDDQNAGMGVLDKLPSFDRNFEVVKGLKSIQLPEESPESNFTSSRTGVTFLNHSHIASSLGITPPVARLSSKSITHEHETPTPRSLTQETTVSSSKSLSMRGSVKPFGSVVPCRERAPLAFDDSIGLEFSLPDNISSDESDTLLVQKKRKRKDSGDRDSKKQKKAEKQLRKLEKAKAKEEKRKRREKKRVKKLAKQEKE